MKLHKQSFAVAVALALLFPSSTIITYADQPERTSSAFSADFDTIYAAVFSDPYPQLPRYAVSTKQFGPSGSNEQNHLRAAARRTLRSREDLIDFRHDQKLFQPNGICFRGTWQMSSESPYDGVFAPRTSLNTIVRASVMLGGTESHDQRAFALAIKFFLADDSGEHTRDLLLMESMGGRRLDHVTDAVVDNAPGFGRLPPLGRITTLLRIRRDMNAALDAHPDNATELRYFPLQHLAGDPQFTAGARSPYWIRLGVPAATPRVARADFRDELSLNHYPDQTLVYSVEIAPHAPGGKRDAAWERLGLLRLTESVVSGTCDQRLHFSHRTDP